MRKDDTLGIPAILIHQVRDAVENVLATPHACARLYPKPRWGATQPSSVLQQDSGAATPYLTFSRVAAATEAAEGRLKRNDVAVFCSRCEQLSPDRIKMKGRW